MTRRQLIIQSIQALREANPGIKADALAKIIDQACTDPDWFKTNNKPNQAFRDTANAYIDQMRKAERWTQATP
jgi:hypothetical protein